MKNTILRVAAGFAVAALLFCVSCDDNGLYRSPYNDGRADKFIQQFDGGTNIPKSKFRVTYHPNGGYGNVPVDKNQYESGDEVIVQAPPDDLSFDDNQFVGWWDGSDGYYSPGTSFYIRDNTTLYALWISSSVMVYQVTVIKGTGSSSYTEGATVTITASVPADSRFQQWTVKSGGVQLDDDKSPQTTFTMPPNDVEVEAIIVTIPRYSVKVISKGSESYSSCTNNCKEGDTITINAGIEPIGEQFGYWNSEEVIFSNKYSIETKFIMPAEAVTVTAVFVEKKETVTIGSQTWMAHNLNVATAAYSGCYGGDYQNCVKYGSLYTRAAAEEGCKKYGDGRWRLPSGEDWDILINESGGKSLAGKNLKAKSGWGPNNDGNGEDIHDFSALPGGVGYPGGSEFLYGYSDLTDMGYWWTLDDIRIMRSSTQENEFIDIVETKKSNLDYRLSVRCIYKDEE
jgi:uncharacterized protein (TIGR02145 family)